MQFSDYAPQPGRPGYVVLNTEDPEVYRVLRQCPFCEKDADVEVPAQGLWDWEHGQQIQKAFPGLTAGERETLLNGSHEECFDRVFAEPDDEEA